MNCMEEDNLLDPLKGTDLYCLHYIYIPRINKGLNQFQEAYSHHRLRSENNRSPFQLWTHGLIERSGDDEAIEGATRDQEVRKTVTIPGSICLLVSSRMCLLVRYVFFSLRIGMALTGKGQLVLMMTVKLWKYLKQRGV